MIETPNGTWITVEEATEIVSRGHSTIYRWIDKGILRAQIGGDGVKRVWGADVLKVESGIRRGRPRGSARP